MKRTALTGLCLSIALLAAVPNAGANRFRIRVGILRYTPVAAAVSAIGLQEINGIRSVRKLRDATDKVIAAVEDGKPAPARKALEEMDKTRDLLYYDKDVTKLSMKGLFLQTSVVARLAEPWLTDRVSRAHIAYGHLVVRLMPKYEPPPPKRGYSVPGIVTVTPPVRWQ